MPGIFQVVRGDDEFDDASCGINRAHDSEIVVSFKNAHDVSDFFFVDFQQPLDGICVNHGQTFVGRLSINMTMDTAAGVTPEIREA